MVDPGRDPIDGCGDLEREGHLTREWIVAALGGQIAAVELSRRLAKHVQDLCPRCREEWQRVEQELAGRVPPGSGAARRLVALAELLHWEEAQLTAELEMEELLAVPEEERRLVLEQAPHRFRGPLLVETLLDESYASIQTEPYQALALAELAIEVAHRVDAEVYGPAVGLELLARATAHRANALRVLDRRREADRLFQFALRCVERAGTDPAPFRPAAEAASLTWAEIAFLQASLYKEQRRFDEARDLLDRAIPLFDRGEEHQLAAEGRIKRACLIFAMGEPVAAADAVSETLPAIERLDDDRLLVIGRYNLACYLCEAGRFEDASRQLEESRDVFERHRDPWVQLRVTWLRGKIARGLGRLEASAQAFLDVRRAFLERQMGYDAAVVSLDLALVYLDQGRSSEVQRLAWEVVPIFAAQDVHPEALAALRLFAEAARREALSHELVGRLSEHLERARNYPEFRFQDHRP